MKSFFNKKIPTIAGLLLLAIAVLTTSYLVNTGVILFGHAAPTDNPENVRITNVSDTTFTVTYKTEAKVIGTITLTNNGKTQTILDDRDEESGVPQAYTVHSISLKNGKSTTSYSFSITSGTTTYQNNNNPFSITTGPTLSATPSATTPFTGKLLDENGNPATNALVFVTTSGGQSLSALTNSQGIYIIPLNAMRSSDFSQQLSLIPTTVMQILATNGIAGTQAQVSLTNANPVPVMTLGNNYNFVISTTPIASESATLGFPPFPSSNLSAMPIITTPKKDEGFSDAQPEFSGKALPDQPVSIEIHSENVVTATVQSDNAGNWTFRPTTPLSPGQHILSITTKNAQGILTTIQQSFTVYASGSQVSQSATPSATLIPTVTPTPIKSRTTPTTSPTTTVSPTPTLVITPTPTIAAKVTPRPTLPPTGSNALIVSSVLGIATTVVGIVLFVLTKGASL